MSASSFFATVRRQWFVILGVLAIGLVVFIGVWPHFRKFTGTATVLAANAPSSTSAVLDPQKDPTASAVGLNDLQTLATSDTVLRRVAGKLRLSDEQAHKLPGEVKAKAVFASDILPIAVTDADPDLAVAAANALTDELTNYSKHIATSRYDELIKNLQSQLAQRRADLAQTDNRIQQLSAQDFYVTPETGTNAINTRLIALQQQEEQLSAAVGGDQAAAAVTSRRPDLSLQLARHEILAQDPSVTAQRQQLGKDVAQLNVARAGYTDRFPGLGGLVAQVRSEATSVLHAENRTSQNPSESASYVAAQLDANKANAALAADRAELASVRGQLSQLNAHLAGSGEAGAQIASLRRNRLAGEQAYTDLSQRLAIADGDRAQAATIGSVVVIDRAIEASPALLGRPAVLGAGLGVVFLWLAITLAFILDGADGRLRTTESIEKLYGKPVFTPVG